MNRIGWAILPLAALMVLASEAGAEIVVNWDGDYVTANTYTKSNASFQYEYNIGGGIDINGDGDTDDYVSYVPLSLTTPWNPTSSGTNATFYGGALVEKNGTTTPSFQYFGINNNDARDEITFITRWARNAIPVIWLQDDFLAGSAAPVQIDADSNVVLDFDRTVNAFIRILVRNGWVFYLSQGAYSSDTTVDLASESFAVYNVSEGDTALYFDETVFPTAGTSLTNVTAIGYLNFVPGNQSGNAVDLLTYRANLDVIPEPAALTLLLTGAAMLARRRRR